MKKGTLEDAIRRDVDAQVGLHGADTSPHYGRDFVPPDVANEFIDWVREQQFCRQLFRNIPMKGPTRDIPRLFGALKVYKQPTIGGTARSTKFTTDTLTLTAEKLMAKCVLDEDFIDDSQFDVVSMGKDHFAAAVAEAEEEAFMIGDPTYANVSSDEDDVNNVVWLEDEDHRLLFNGLLSYAANDAGVNVPAVNADGNEISLDYIIECLYKLGKYGKNQPGLSLLLNSWSATQLMLDDKLITKDVMGDQATLVTGVVGKLFNTIPVVNTSYANTPTVASGEGILVLNKNVLIGDRRAIRMRVVPWADDEIVKIIVSERIAFAWERDAAMCYLYGLKVPAGYGS
jgi:HK97 family phage major capsid protein